MVERGRGGEALRLYAHPAPRGSDESTDKGIRGADAMRTEPSLTLVYLQSLSWPLVKAIASPVEFS